MDMLYLTDNTQDLIRTLNTRKPIYTKDLRDKWPHSTANYYRTEEGEEVLEIEGFEVMREFERPYMESLAQTATQGGGRVLNVGFGLGIVDQEIQRVADQVQLKEHWIVEFNKNVMKRARKWKSTQKSSIFLVEKSWEQALDQFYEKGMIFDGVVYDAYPLDKKDIHRDFVPFIEKLLRLQLVKEKKGIVTFYMDSPDGFGNQFLKYVKNLGVGSAELKKIDVRLPKENQYWDCPYFYTPTLSDISY